MITEALIGVVIQTLSSFLGWVPDWTPPTQDFATTGLTVGNALGLLDNYFPVSVLGACLAAVIGLKFVLIFWNLLVFIYDRFPLKFT